MNAPGQRTPLRADAARNAERLVRAARTAFREVGPEVPLEEIARRAGVGVATLYRRFSNKEELVRAILEGSFAERLEPAIGLALADEDPWNGMVTALEAALEMASEERYTLEAAEKITTVVGSLAERFFGALDVIVRRGQDTGRIRPDLRPDDLPRLVFMVVSTLSLEPAQDWRRYLALLLDALRPAAATALPDAAPLRNAAPPDRPGSCRPC